MSSNLVWRPKNTKGNGLSDDLKFLLRRAYGEPVKTTLGPSDRKILEGMELATSNKKLEKEISDLIRAIDRHEEIIVEETWG